MLLPSSLAADTPHLRERTFRVSMVARFLASFRVDNLILYDEDLKPTRNAEFVREVMEYLNTAPYLRRRLFPLKRSLRYVGSLPPLNIPTHPESPEEREHHYREGLVVSAGRVSVVEAGLGRPVKVRRRLKRGARVVVEVDPPSGRVRVMSRRKAPVYAGFRTAVVSEPLDRIAAGYDLRLATSRLGKPVDELAGTLASKLRSARSVCVAFGSARRGLYEIARLQGFSLEEAFDAVLNVAPTQGVRTIRTEEAVGIALAALSLAERLGPA